jgi:N-acetylmuramoyl-L-alanine amidase
MNSLRSCYAVLFILMGFVLPFYPAWAEHAPVKQFVVIDPAHGGTDRGVKLSDNEYEKDITLKIALLMQKELQAMGNVRIRLTRTTDQNVSLPERVKVTPTSGTGIFVSLHVNAAFGKEAAGYEVYFPGFSAAPSGQNTAAVILKDMATNKSLNESVALSQSILQNLQIVFPGKDRQLRNAPVLILEGLAVPAVAVEIGFATNRVDKKTLIDERGKKNIAQALSRGIKDFLRRN